MVGESYGGMIAQYLAGCHGDSWRHLAIVVAAAEVSDWGKAVDSRLSSALARADKVGVGRAFAEYAIPGDRGRWVLPRIDAPVMLLCGDRDRFFPQDVVDETVRLIPDCTLVRYEGQGHMKVATSKRVAHDVLAFVNRN